MEKNENGEIVAGERQDVRIGQFDVKLIQGELRIYGNGGKLAITPFATNAVRIGINKEAPKS